jgi:carbonic anhydrase
MFSLVGLDNQGKKQNLDVKTRENKWYSQLSPMAKEEHLKKQRIAHEEKKMQLQAVVKVKHQAKKIQQSILRVLTMAFLHL